MIMIVAHHFSVHGGFEYSINTISVNRLWVQFIQMGGKIGVDIFVLISGYFLISANLLKTNKIIRLWLQMFLYSILLFILFVASGVESFSINELINRCLPVASSHWWFASTYFVLYLLSPYINRLLHAFSKREFQRYLLFLTILWCVVQTFTGISYQCNYLIWFVYLYSVAGYIRLHGTKNDIKGETYILLAVLVILLNFLLTVVFDLLGTRVPFFGNKATFFYGMQSIPIVAVSVLLLVGFSKIKIGYSRAINVISSATFGVYLIHDDSFVRPWLWKTVFANAAYSESGFLIPYSLFAIVLVFSVSAVIELIRIHLLEKHYMKYVNAAADIMDNMKEKFFSLDVWSKI